MPTLQEILRDPNYVNANPATKKAIFDRWAPSDQNYTGANPATQAAIRQRFGVGMVEAPVEEPAKPEESGFLRQAADVPLSVGRGALTGVRLIADAFGAGSKASQAIKGAEGYLASLMSAQAKGDEQEVARIMKDAEDKGALEQVKAGLKAFSVAPIDLISQGLGTAAPAVLSLLGGKVLGAGMVGARLIGAGVGAAMGAGTAKGGIYEATKEELTKAGLPEDQAEKRAQEAQAYGGKNLDQILLSTGLGAFASSTGLESATRRILLRSGVKEAAKQEAADMARRGIVQTGKRITKGAAAESVPEFIQAGQEQVAQNIALQREGFDVPTFRGAVGAGTLEALAGAGLGAGFGALESTQGGLREKARRDAADILEQERIAAGEELPRTEPAQAPAEVSDIEELERQFGMAPPSIEPEAEAAVAETTEPAAEPAAIAEEEPLAEPPAAAEAQTEPAARTGLQDLVRNQEAATEYDTPENRLRESDTFGQDLSSLIKEELESYGRAAAKNRRLTEKAMDMRETWAAASDAATIAFATNDYEQFKPYENLFRRTANMLKSEIGKTAKLIKADEKALAEIDRPRSIAEEMEGVAVPTSPEVQALQDKLKKTEDDVARLKNRGMSLWTALAGKLSPSEVKDIGGLTLQVGKNQFLNLVAKKGKRGTEISELVDDGLLNDFLPPNMRNEAAQYDNTESTRYIIDRLTSGKYTTYETDVAIKQIGQEALELERRIQEELSLEEINREIQLANEEQREADQAVADFAAEGEAGTAAQRQAEEATELDDLERRAADAGIDVDAIREEVYYDTRGEEDINYERTLADRLRGALSVQEQFLAMQTEEDLKAKQEADAAAEKARKAEEKAKEEKAKADEAAADFVLTGSDREADEAAARGQSSMFSAEKGQTGYSPDPEDQRIEKELTGKTMLQAADWAVQNAPNAFSKVIAEKVRNRLRDLQRKGVELEFKVEGGNTRSARMSGARGMTISNWGEKELGTKTKFSVTLNGAAVLQNQAGYPPGTRYTTLLHELIHVATMGQLQFTPFSDPIRKQLRELSNAIVARFNEDAKAGKLPPVMQKYYKRENNVLRDDDEVMAWGLTDGEVQKYYADIKVGEKSAMSKLVDLVRQILGLGKPYESALDRLVTVSESLLDADIDTIEAVLGKSGRTLGEAKAAPAKGEQQALFEREVKEAPPVNSAAFKRWFGKSKVVDENGRPAVVYRGEHGATTDGDLQTILGTYTFTNDPAVASTYAQTPNDLRMRADQPRVLPAYLKIENPIFNNADDPFVDFSEISQKLGREEAIRFAKKYADRIEGTGNWEENFADDFESVDDLLSQKPSAVDQLYVEAYPLLDDLTFVQAAKEAGFDGAINKGTGESMDAVEYRVFNKTQIKSAIGNIGTFDPNNPDIRYQQEGGAPKGRQNILGKPVLPAGSMPPGKGYELGTWTEPTDTKMAGELGKDDIIYWLQDKMVDTKRVVQAITAKAGKIATQWNPYLQEELYHGRTAKATKDFLKDELRPLMQEMQRDGVTIGELEKYLQNRHAEAYNRHVAKVNPNNPDMQDGGSGIKTEDARKYLDDLPEDKRKVYERLAKRVDSITKGTRNLLVKSGLEKRETIDAWEKAFPDYVPLMREEGDFDYTTTSFGVGRGFDVRGSFSKRAMGSKKNVVDILANIALAREHAIVKSEKNRVAQAVYGLAVQNPNPDFWLAVNPAAEKVPEIAIEEMRSLGIDEEAAKFLMKEPRQRAVDPKKNEVIARINATLRNNNNVLSTRVNGENRYVFFNPNNERSRRAAEALKNLDADHLSYVMGMLAKVTRWFASVNTQYNPIFGAYNFLRDVQGAALQLSTTPLAGKQKEVTKNVLPALRAIYTSMRKERKGEKVDTEMAKLWEDFQKAGGQTGFRDMFSRSQERAEALQREFAQMSEGKLKAAGRATLDWLSDYNDTMENAVRLAAYKVALDEGKNKDEAASIAKNLTVNFNKKGQVATQAGALYAFFNAAVQGTTRLVQTLRGPAGKKIMAGGLLLGTMQALLLAAAGFDEEEPPEFVRERNIVIPTGGDSYVMFPMPLGYHVIPGLSRIVTEWTLSGFKNTPDRVASLTGMFLEAFNPIGNAGWSVQSIAPTFADPLVALAENKDWTGKPIARKDFSNLDPTPGYTRAKDTASWVSTQISKFLNFASGGTKYQPGVISPTPDQIDFLIGQATGGLGREILKAEQTITKTATGEELPPYKIPVVGRFYGETKSSAAESSRFYKNMEQINKLENEIKGRRENREPLGDFLKENPEARLAGRAREIYSDVKKLRERREKLVERDAPRESVKAVETQITNKMRLLNEQVEKLKK